MSSSSKLRHSGRGGRQTDKLMDTTPVNLGPRPTIPYEADIIARIKPQDT